MPVAGLQFGVAPEHAGCAAYCPFDPHSSGTLPLQIAVPGVHTLHWPAPSHLPTPAAQLVPDAFGRNPHANPVQLDVRHSLAGAGHCADASHSTHVALASSQYGFGDAQATVGSHCPLLLHDWTLSPTHFTVPGVQA